MPVVTQQRAGETVFSGSNQRATETSQERNSRASVVTTSFCGICKEQEMGSRGIRLWKLLLLGTICLTLRNKYVTTAAKRLKVKRNFVVQFLSDHVSVLVCPEHSSILCYVLDQMEK